LVFKRHNLIFPFISHDIRRALSESNDRPQRGNECAVAYGDDFTRFPGFFEEYFIGPSSKKKEILQFERKI